MTAFLKEWIKDALYIIACIPLVLAAFPVPLLFPVLLIWQAIEQPEETMLAVIYFIWLIISLIYIYCYDRKREG